MEEKLPGPEWDEVEAVVLPCISSYDYFLTLLLLRLQGGRNRLLQLSCISIALGLPGCPSARPFFAFNYSPSKIFYHVLGVLYAGEETIVDGQEGNHPGDDTPSYDPQAAVVVVVGGSSWWSSFHDDHWGKARIKATYCGWRRQRRILKGKRKFLWR
ncbi:hypothetical protein CDL15_Pgr025934 [Punica granatum]|uniref:Uncharacterized protein n=1 Tax=Punica granatum TaxID=22663 RepID=A0A218WB31_PUNGR|nr:hypothetical protein CDL15_Pgr025934 [Punica granatum]